MLRCHYREIFACSYYLRTISMTRNIIFIVVIQFHAQPAISCVKHHPFSLFALNLPSDSEWLDSEWIFIENDHHAFSESMSTSFGNHNMYNCKHFTFTAYIHSSMHFKYCMKFSSQDNEETQWTTLGSCLKVSHVIRKSGISGVDISVRKGWELARSSLKSSRTFEPTSTRRWLIWRETEIKEPEQNRN